MKIGTRLLTQIILNLPNYIFWKDRRSVYRGCNLNFAKLLNCTDPQEVIGKTDDELPWGKFTGHIYKKEDERIIKTGESILNKEVPMRFSEDSNEILLSVSKVPLFNDKEKIIGVLGIFIDITELKKTKANLEITAARLEGMVMVSGSMAHELRTPLASIAIGAKTANKMMNPLINSYKLARSAHLPVPNISETQIKLLKELLESLQKKVEQSNMVIDMLLANISSPQGLQEEYIKCSAKEVINQALARYIFPTSKKPKIYWNNLDDFIFTGREILVIHILFNLFKNAAYFIEKAGKGAIYIWIDHDENHNFIYFKDTGYGIQKKDLPFIFDRFFTKSTNKGTGIGLAFCKMVMEEHGGNIKCDSVEGEYTEFILTFPKIIG